MHLEVSKEAPGDVELCLKWCTNVTSKNHNHRRIFIRCVMDFVDHAGNKLHVEASTIPLPWLVKAPPPMDVEVFTDGAPGGLVTLVGEPFRKARGLRQGVKPHAQLRGVPGSPQAGCNMSLEDVPCKRNTAIVVRLPEGIPNGEYEIRVTGLSVDFNNEGIFPLHIAAGQKMALAPPPQAPPALAGLPPLPPHGMVPAPTKAAPPMAVFASAFAVPRSPLVDMAPNMQASPNRLLDAPFSPAPGFASMPGTPWVMAQIMGGPTGVAQVDGGFAAAWGSMPGTPGVHLFGSMPGTPYTDGDLQLGRADSKDSVISADLNALVESMLDNGLPEEEIHNVPASVLGANSCLPG